MNSDEIDELIEGMESTPLKSAWHDEAIEALRQLQADNQRLVAAVREKIDEWRKFKFDGHVPPEDGGAAEYAEEQARDCADGLQVTLDTALQQERNDG